MSGPVNFVRRRTMKLAALLGIAPLSVVSAGEASIASPLACQLARVFRDQANAAAVGRACLRALPGECDASSVTNDLCDHLQTAGYPLHGISDTQLREALASLQREDFRAGRVVRVDGWVLAATEVRLCALAALT